MPRFSWRSPGASPSPDFPFVPGELLPGRLRRAVKAVAALCAVARSASLDSPTRPGRLAGKHKRISSAAVGRRAEGSSLVGLVHLGRFVVVVRALSHHLCDGIEKSLEPLLAQCLCVLAGRW